MQFRSHRECMTVACPRHVGCARSALSPKFYEPPARHSSPLCNGVAAVGVVGDDFAGATAAATDANTKESKCANNIISIYVCRYIISTLRVYSMRHFDSSKSPARQQSSLTLGWHRATARAATCVKKPSASLELRLFAVAHTFAHGIREPIANVDGRVSFRVMSSRFIVY